MKWLSRPCVLACLPHFPKSSSQRRARHIARPFACFFPPRSTQAITATPLHDRSASFYEFENQPSISQFFCPLPLSPVEVTTLDSPCIFFSSGCELSSSRRTPIIKFQKPVHSSILADPKWTRVITPLSRSGWSSEWAFTQLAIETVLIGNVLLIFLFFLQCRRSQGRSGCTTLGATQTGKVLLRLGRRDIAHHQSRSQDTAPVFERLPLTHRFFLRRRKCCRQHHRSRPDLSADGLILEACSEVTLLVGGVDCLAVSVEDSKRWHNLDYYHHPLIRSILYCLCLHWELENHRPRSSKTINMAYPLTDLPSTNSPRATTTNPLR